MVGGMCSLLPYGNGICHYAFIITLYNVFSILYCVCQSFLNLFFFNLVSVN